MVNQMKKIITAKSFGEEIRRRRKELGYTQAFLAEYVGVNALKSVSIVFLPITMVASGFWSFHSIENDCKKYLDIFGEAFQKMKFKVLEHYIDAFIGVINGLDDLGKRLVK